MIEKSTTFFRGQVFFIYVFTILGIALLIPEHSIAQNIDTIKVNQLREVEINTNRLLRQSLSPVPLQLLSSSELKRINSLSVADAIRYFSGVQLKDYGGIGGLKTVNVRSMGSNHTAIFYNGIQLGNAQNGQVDLGKYSLDNLEEIALLSGQNTDLLQPAKAYASASSIFLRTKSPSFSLGKKNNLQTTFKTGDFGLINPSINYQQKLSDNLSGGISMEYVRAHGRYKFNYTNGVYDTTAVRNNGDVERIRLEASLFGTLKNDGKWNALFYSFVSERGLPGAIVSNKFNYNQRIWDRNLFIQGSLSQKLGNRISLLLNSKLSYDYTRFLDPEYVAIDGFLDNRFHEKEAYISAAVQYRISKIWELALSSDFQNQRLDANLYRFAYPNRSSVLNVLSTSIKTGRLNLQANVLSTTVIDKVREYGSAGNKQIFSPTILLSWKVFKDEELRLRAFYKDIFRMPTFNDLYYTFIGNTLLKPEFTKQYNLGFTYFKASGTDKWLPFEVQTDVYYNEVTDKIIAQPGANLIRWIMYNIGKVEVRGLESSIKSGYRLSKDLTLGTAVNYTYQQAIDVTSVSEESYKHQIPYIPTHSGSLLAKVDFKNFKFNYSFIYTGARYNQKANIIYNYMEPWYTHDTAIGYELPLKKSTLNINAEVNNLLNQYYDVIPNFPMPGRNYRLTLSYVL
ncbi:MAG: TonB-dependent receptor [Pedobacter sp.]|nr:MAG: TonB-dependent receptor [Pedobacter sp.]